MSLLPRAALVLIASYAGATFALLLPFSSPAWEPLAFGARLIGAALGVR